MTVKKMSQFKFEQLICGDNIVTYLGLRLGEKKKKKSQVWGVAMTGVGGVGQKLQI